MKIKSSGLGTKRGRTSNPEEDEKEEEKYKGGPDKR